VGAVLAVRAPAVAVTAFGRFAVLLLRREPGVLVAVTARAPGGAAAAALAAVTAASASASAVAAAPASAAAAFAPAAAALAAALFAAGAGAPALLTQYNAGFLGAKAEEAAFPLAHYHDFNLIAPEAHFSQAFFNGVLYCFSFCLCLSHFLVSLTYDRQPIFFCRYMLWAKPHVLLMSQ
jgi:hypothetical protein